MILEWNFCFILNLQRCKEEDYNWIEDKKIKDSNTLKRPDLLLDLEEHVLIVEIDEHQHKKVSIKSKKERREKKKSTMTRQERIKMYEKNRTEELKKNIDKPLIIIRLNPDKYESEGVVYKSPWKKTKENKYEVINQQEWDKRLTKLFEEITVNISDKPEANIKIVKLFFDED